MRTRNISRRSFLKYGMAGATMSVWPTLASISATEHGIEVQTRSPNNSTTSPQISNRSRILPTRVDAHGHTVKGLTPETVFGLMDMAGISHMVLMAKGRNDGLTREIYEHNPQRILPFVGTMYQAWHHQDERVLDYTEKQLNSGIYKGVGEVMLRIYPNRVKQEVETNVPADSAFIKRLADIVEYHDAVMLVHMEPEPRAIQSLENLLDYNKKLKLIWAHCGTMSYVGLKMFSYADLAEIMDRHPNLYTDIAGVQPEIIATTGGRRRPPITTNSGKLLSHFTEILQKHSDRVLFGLDTPWIECWAEEPFMQWTKWADNVVAQIGDTRKAEMIMHGNAARLFKI